MLCFLLLILVLLLLFGLIILLLAHHLDLPHCFLVIILLLRLFFVLLLLSALVVWVSPRASFLSFVILLASSPALLLVSLVGFELAGPGCHAGLWCFALDLLLVSAVQLVEIVLKSKLPLLLLKLLVEHLLVLVVDILFLLVAFLELPDELVLVVVVVEVQVL